MSVVISIVFAVAAGVSLVIQQALNASLRVTLNSAVWTGFVSYVVGMGCMLALAFVLRDPIPSADAAGRIPWWAWSAGVFGAVFIALSILLVPLLGAATFIALLITGQMFASMTFDHFGWLGLAQRSIDLPRVIGAVLLIGGVILIRR